MVPRVLTVAGSDSGGGAGIQADLKAMTAHAVYGLSVVTAITSQNTMTVDAVQIVECDMIEKQFRAVVSDIGCEVVKTGMLGNRDTVRLLSGLLKEYKISQTVVDPVMISTSGSRLLEHDAIKSIIHDLLPITLILTPNVQEARLLLAESMDTPVSSLPEIESLEDIKQMGAALQRLGPQYVLIKGGHLPLNKDMQVCTTDAAKVFVADTLCGPLHTTVITSAWSPSRNTHGTGCTLASAIACNLAHKKNIEEAVKDAISYVHGAIVHSFDIGAGSGPLNHMYRLCSLPFIPGQFLDYLMDHCTIRPVWKAYTEHAFVVQLADGSLPVQAFHRFLRQDYLYLIQYARLQALASYKSDNMDDIAGSAEIILHIREELKLHTKYCEDFGISKAELDREEESVACTVYTRYMESIGNSRDWMSLQVALAACLIGYGEIGKKLYESEGTNRTSIYWRWIQNYVADDYARAVVTGRELIERHAVNQSPSKIEELVEIFRRVTEYEALFWTDAMSAESHTP